LEFLDRIHLVLKRYLAGAEVTEDALRQNFSTVYLLLDEMLDSGMPFVSEGNLLEIMIAAPSTLGKVAKVISGGSNIKTEVFDEPSGALGAIQSAIGNNVSCGTSLGCQPDTWWRASNLAYTANEVYVDIVEQIHCSLDSNDRVVTGEITGEIQMRCTLSGTPDLTLRLKDPAVLADAAFHPCIRIEKWDRDKTLSFIPPDGVSVIAKYWVPQSSPVEVPVSVKAKLTFHPDVGKLDVTAGPKLHLLKGTNTFIDQFAMEVKLPESIASVTTLAKTGNVKFDETTKRLRWDVGKFPETVSLEASLAYKTVQGAPEVPREEKCTAQVFFQVKGWAVSGMKCDALEIRSVSYTPYKGCRYTTESGRFELRLN